MTATGTDDVQVKDADAEKSRTTLQTVERALALLELVASSPRTLTVAEAAQALGLNISTCHHLVRTLEARRYLRRDEARCLRPDVGLVALSAAFSTGQGFLESLDRILTEISARSGETVYASEWDGNDMVIKHVSEGSYTLRVAGLAPGLRGEPHSRASGKAVLAFLDEEAREAWLRTADLHGITPYTITDRDVLREELRLIRERGYSTDLQEFALGVCCAAAPYFDAAGRVVGAVTLSSAQPRYEEHGAEYVAAVREGADRITALLGAGHAGPAT